MNIKQKNALLVIQQKDNAVLTPAQKAFNQLSKKVARLKQDIQKTLQENEQMLDMHLKKILPLDTQKANTYFALAQAMEVNAANIKLTKKQRENVRNAILYLCDCTFSEREPSEAEEAFYDRWSTVSYKEESNMKFEDMKGQMENLMKDFFGLDINMSDLNDDPESFARFQQELNEKMKEGQFQGFPGGKSARKERPKTKKQLEKERILKEAEALKQKSIRSIYLSLAKALHPDKAVDEKDRLRKEEMIKKVTQAYQENDFLALLQLESEWIASEKHDVNTVPDSQLQLYVDALRKQVRELETERAQIAQDPRYQILRDYANHTPKTFAREVNAYGRRLKAVIAHIEQEIASIQYSGSKDNLLRITESILQEADMEENFSPLDFFTGM